MLEQFLDFHDFKVFFVLRARMNLICSIVEMHLSCFREKVLLQRILCQICIIGKSLAKIKNYCHSDHTF